MTDKIKEVLIIRDSSEDQSGHWQILKGEFGWSESGFVEKK